MRGGFIFSIGFLALVVAGGGSAIAADLPLKAPPAAAPAVPDWTGFYIGIHAGGGWGHTDFDPAFVSNSGLLLSVAPPNANPTGGVFGGQVGYNWQWGPVVGGLELDFSGADISQSSAFTFANPILAGFTFTRDVKIEELATARGRLGYLILPNLLLYGTAGVGWGHARLDMTQTQVALGGVISSSSFANEFGWVAGAGLEWKVWDHWLLRGEYLHYDFARNNDLGVPNFFFPGATTPPFAEPFNSRTTLDVGRAAISYKF